MLAHHCPELRYGTWNLRMAPAIFDIFTFLNLEVDFL